MRRAKRSGGSRTAPFSLRCAGVASDGPVPEPFRRAGPVAMYVGNLERYQGIDLLLQDSG
jgi:hypothetical protein